MSDDLDRRLREVPARVPGPDPRLTERVRERLLGARRRPPRRPFPAALIAATVAGIAIGYWIIPHEEQAIGAADPPAITIRADPTVLGRINTGSALMGAIITREAGEYVLIEENVCGRGWTQLTGTHTAERGEWRVDLDFSLAPQANTLYRAKWRGRTSATASVAVRPMLSVTVRGRNVYRLDVYSFRSLAGRTAHLERYDRKTSKWIVAARAKLMSGGYGYSDRNTRAIFGVKLPANTIIRAVVPASQARPCHLAGYSGMLTTP